jgi:hypothetical protein
MYKSNTGWVRVLMLIIPYLIIVGVFQLVGMVLMGADPTNLGDFANREESTTLLVSSFFSVLGTLLTLWIFMHYIDKERFDNIGLVLKNRVKELNLGIIIGFLIIGLGFIILYITNQIELKGIVFDPQELLISVMIFLLVSVMEETLVRGYILKNLMLSFNPYLALFITSLLFAAFHLPNPNINIVGFINIFLAGILLGITYIHTRNLWFPIGLHFSWNLTQTQLGFNVSGKGAYSILELNYSGANILNGGDFGFEGSILATIIQVFVIVGLGLYISKRNNFFVKFAH